MRPSVLLPILMVPLLAGCHRKESPVAMPAADMPQLRVQGLNISQWTYHQGKQSVYVNLFNLSRNEVASVTADVVLEDTQGHEVDRKPITLDNFEEQTTGYKGSLLPRCDGYCTVVVEMATPQRYDIDLKSATYYAKGDDFSDLGHLFAAVTRGDNDAVLNAISKDAKLAMAATPDTGITVIHMAAAANNLALVKTLIDKGVNYDAPSKTGSTPLLCAINNGASDVASYLLDRGATLNIKKGGMTAMEMAAMYCSGAVIEKMIAKGADPNELRGKRANPLEMASKSGNTEAAKVLIDHGANPNYQDRAHTPPIFHAVDSNQAKMVTFLIEHGAQVDLANSYGYTPLMIAAGRGSADVVKALLDKGANSQLTGPDGKTPLQIAEQYGNTQAAALLKSAKH